MIKGFDIETQPLTDYEEVCLLPIVRRGLELKVGRASAVSSSHIVSRMKACGYKLDGPRLRKIINHIRNNDLVPGLIATSDGYYVAQSESELDDYIESLIGRENAIRSVRKAMERQRDRMFVREPEQLSLFNI
jgi:hypothetical protein